MGFFITFLFCFLMWFLLFCAAASFILLLGWRNIIDTIHQYELVISASSYLNLHRMSFWIEAQLNTVLYEFDQLQLLCSPNRIWNRVFNFILGFLHALLPINCVFFYFLSLFISSWGFPVWVAALVTINSLMVG